MEMVQEAVAEIEPVQEFELMLNSAALSPPRETLLKVSAAVPAFVTVMGCGALEVPCVVDPGKVSVPGTIVTSGRLSRATPGEQNGVRTTGSVIDHRKAGLTDARSGRRVKQGNVAVRERSENSWRLAAIGLLKVSGFCSGDGD